MLRVYSTPLEQTHKTCKVPNVLHILAETPTDNNKELLAELQAKEDELMIMQGKGPEEIKGIIQKAHEVIKEIAEI